MGEIDETKLEEDFHESEEKLDAVEDDREEKASMAEHYRSKQLEEELQRLKKQCSSAEEGRRSAESELQEARTEADDANSRLTEALAAEKAELDSVKKSLAAKNQELKNKEKEIESLTTIQRKIGEKDDELDKLKETLIAAKNVESRVRELEHELERQKESAAKAVESLAATKKELEESRVEARSLRDKLSMCDNGKDRIPTNDNDPNMNEMLETLSDELQLTKESLFRAQEGERAALSKAQSLLSDIGKLRNELKLATNAEINSAKAMDDLAITLSEVVAESNKVKSRLEVVEMELEKSRREVNESRREAERSALEAEETLLSWNEKETGFLKCIRRAEEEKNLVVEENIRLLESIKSSKEENNKLRDILKQALNEANVAKEAANIAKAENFQLKDSLADKEEALEFLTMEIENFKAHEAELLSISKKLGSPIERESGFDEGNLGDKEGKINKPSLVGKMDKESPKILAKAFSFNLKELRIHTKHNNKDVDSGDEKNKDPIGEDRECEDEDSEAYDPLKGSIFDVMDSPGSARHRRKGSISSGDGTTLTPEELEQLEDSQLHDLENGRFSSRRRRLLRKFGDLIIRRRPSYAEQSK